MAKLMNPLMSTEARGRVGGIVYNTWRGLRYAKVKTAPSQPRTARQLTIRAINTSLVRAWASLTDAQRAAWRTYAAEHPDTDWTGSTQRVTGLNWFCRCNTRLLDMGKSTISSPPSAPAPASVQDLELTGGSGQISIAFTTVSGSDTTIDIWLHGPHSKGQISTIVQARHKVYAPAETSPVVIQSLAPGTYTVYARMISESTGLASQFVSARTTVT